MPIRPENKHRYPKDWKAIVAKVRDRSDNRCECQGECGLHRGRRCKEVNGAAATWARGKIVLTTAHLNHTPEDNRMENLRHMCQRCHLLYDRDHHRETAERTRDAKWGQKRLEFAT